MYILRWLKLYTEILDDPKIRLLAFEDRWHYVALLCCKADGLMDERENLWERLIQVKLGLAQVEYDSLKKRLMEVCLIDENWNPSGWEKRQAAGDPAAAERQRKYREKQRKRNVTHNVTATSRVEGRSKKKNLEEGSARFDAFWYAYPKKVDKQKSMNRFMNLKPDIQEKVISNVKSRAREDRQWLEGFAPNPTTYLNNQRWDDEWQKAKTLGQPSMTRNFDYV